MDVLRRAAVMLASWEDLASRTEGPVEHEFRFPAMNGKGALAIERLRPLPRTA